jgi:ribosomal protein S18 acetylase RimI-like enzyme
LTKTIRSAVFSDQHSLAEMLQNNFFVHYHLDWRTPLGWIGSSPFLLIEDENGLIGALACPPEPAGVAWLRLFTIEAHASELEVWTALWETAKLELARRPGITAAAIVMLPRMIPLLEGSGFAVRQQLVMLEHECDGNELDNAVVGFSLRPMLTHDLPKVAEVDAEAFGPLWYNSLQDVSRAHSRAFLAQVAELDGQVIGFQISTRNSLGVHLARLAVRPVDQGKGVGQALVKDLFLKARQRGVSRFTVNTQSDNVQSLAIYKKLGFRESGERFPVYTLQISE